MNKTNTLKPKALPSAVLFDFDGVLFHSFPVHRRAWSKAFETIFSRPMPDYPDYILTGSSSLEIARFISRSQVENKTAESLADCKLKFLMDSDSPPDLLPGATEWFGWLLEQNIPFGVVSNAPRIYLEKNLERYGLIAPVVLGMDDVQAPKPAPDPYQKAAERLSIPSEEYGQIWVFEDSITGVRSAIEAGMQVYGIAPPEKAQQLIRFGAQAVYESLQEANAEILHNYLR
ncbi:MAG TPA: HAD family phosphatase [Pontiella sp.]